MRLGIVYPGLLHKNLYYFISLNVLIIDQLIAAALENILLFL